jgi:hypothetical protein
MADTSRREKPSTGRLASSRLLALAAMRALLYTTPKTTLAANATEMAVQTSMMAAFMSNNRFMSARTSDTSMT